MFEHNNDTTNMTRKLCPNSALEEKKENVKKRQTVNQKKNRSKKEQDNNLDKTETPSMTNTTAMSTKKTHKD